MKIKSITANNYRTLENITLPFAASYCTISGRNNAGKSCVIQLFETLFGKSGPRYIRRERDILEYTDDKTQWHKANDPIEIVYLLEINRADDPALLSFISKILNREIAEDPTTISIAFTVPSSGEIVRIVTLNGVVATKVDSAEIVRKIQESNLMFLYNSTTRRDDIYYGVRGRTRSIYEVILSREEKRQLDDAAKQTELKLKRLAKQNREELGGILGRLSESYEVEFSPLDGFSTRHMPFGINLKDKSVEVPLDDWGSGTQNRTQILMAVLQANRIKTTGSVEDKITPIVLVEEPESFLHPTAQSEFGLVLRTIASDFGIQIIVTTHSPYMLNQESPESNILLCRTVYRKKQMGTTRVDTSGDNWMAPFAEHLGIVPAEFQNWLPLFSLTKTRVLLVEGAIDQSYLELLQNKDYGIDKLSAEIEVVPYGGKDTLKNTLLVQFVLSKFDNVFVTYDLDCKDEIAAALARLGLKDKDDHIALGIDKPGRNAIEGLLPESVLAAVNGKETDLVMQLGSADTKARRHAKDNLKKKYLEEFKSRDQFKEEELKALAAVVTHINRRLMPS